MTVNFCPPMIMVPVLLPSAVLEEILYETVPLPVLLLPAVTVIHESFLVAVQEQVLDDGVTATLPKAPNEANP